MVMKKVIISYLYYILLILFFNIFILFLLEIGITNSKDTTNRFNDWMPFFAMDVPSSVHFGVFI
jgi:hypothetical protein